MHLVSGGRRLPPVAGDELEHLNRVQCGALAQVITDYPQDKTAWMRRVQANPPNINGIRPRGAERRRIVRLAWMVHNDDARRGAKDLARLVWLHRPLELDVDGFGMTDRD